MADTERRGTGEQPTVVVKTNGGKVWMWMIGTIVSVGVIVGAGVVTIKTDIAAMKVDIRWIKDTITIERGMVERHDREIRTNDRRLIKLEP